MKYVIGVDLGTSAVKVLLVSQNGEVKAEASKEYPLIQERSGYSEQNPEDWVEQTYAALQELMHTSGVSQDDIEGISYSGQMHGLVLLDDQHRVMRKAILWNDTRTTAQCTRIRETLGADLLRITKNPALEGFTLPKLLWVQEHEPRVLEQAAVFMLPKDYVRFRMCGEIHMEYSDAAGTLLLDVARKEWSTEVLQDFQLNPSLCPPLVPSHAHVGNLLPQVATRCGLSSNTKVFAGGADNACGAIGSNILSDGKTLCSLGTSGVVLSYESQNDKDFGGDVHYFNHAKADAYYTMGVTLAAGDSLSWFKNTFAASESYDSLLAGVEQVPAGSGGLLFTPYIVGERTPHADSVIRGSFIGMDRSHERLHFVRSVMEGITFSLNESIHIFRQAGKTIDTVVSIGGGAKNPTWLQMQADIFNARVIAMANEQGPGMGAAMLAAYGCGWFSSLEECADQFIHYQTEYEPDPKQVDTYRQLFDVYRDVYPQTKGLNEHLVSFRDQ